MLSSLICNAAGGLPSNQSVILPQRFNLALSAGHWCLPSSQLPTAIHLDIIAIGFIGCAGGGLISIKIGSAKVAAYQLCISDICCLLSPLFFNAGVSLFIIFLLVWGLTVVGDSPQFSTLNAENAPKEYVGSALTIVNSIGFLVTVFSIQLVNSLLPVMDADYIFWVLVHGPVLGLWALKSLLKIRE